MGGAAIVPPTSLVEKDKELPRDFPYEEDSRTRSQCSKAAIPPPVYEEQDRPRSLTGPGNSFLANMGGTVAHKITQKYVFSTDNAVLSPCSCFPRPWPSRKPYFCMILCATVPLEEERERPPVLEVISYGINGFYITTIS